MNNNLTPTKILKEINTYIVQHSGWEAKRDYVSMSHIAECPRKIVREFNSGYTLEAYTHHMCYAGYTHEQDMRAMLMALGYIRQVNVEVIAPFDARLKGHLDGLLDDETLIEFKSISNKQWDKLVQNDRVMWKHFVQVQLYMHYGGYRMAIVIYRNRESYQHMVIGVPYNEHQAQKFEEKAKAILRAIDEDRLPECECEHCKE